MRAQQAAGSAGGGGTRAERWRPPCTWSTTWTVSVGRGPGGETGGGGEGGAAAAGAAAAAARQLVLRHRLGGGAVPRRVISRRRGASSLSAGERRRREAVVPACPPSCHPGSPTCVAAVATGQPGCGGRGAPRSSALPAGGSGLHSAGCGAARFLSRRAPPALWRTAGVTRCGISAGPARAGVRVRSSPGVNGHSRYVKRNVPPSAGLVVPRVRCWSRSSRAQAPHAAFASPRECV